MTDTNHIEVLRAVRSVFDHIPQPCAERDALDAAITTLSARASAEDAGDFASDTAALAFLRLVGNGNPNIERAVKRLHSSLIARASAGEGGDTRCDQYVLDSFNGARKCMNKRAPGDTLCKKHRATAEQTGYTAAPQPATGGRDWRNEAFNLADTVIERIECGDKQGARDAIGEEFERLAAAPQTQPTINSSEIDSKLTDARPATPPAHGDGEGDKSEMADSDRLNSGKPVSPREIDKNQAHDLALSPTPEAQEARDAVQWAHDEFEDKEHVARVRGDIGLANYYGVCKAKMAAALAMPAQGEGNNG